MTTYSLKDLRIIFNCKQYLTKERFIHYFVHRFGLEERDAIEKFKIFSQFPIGLYYEEKCEDLELILPKAIEILKEIQEGPQLTYKFFSDSKELKKLIYKENEVIHELVIDFNSTSDIITYAEILKRKIEIIAYLSFCAKVSIDKKELLIFEGDIFDTNDHFYGYKSTVYIALKDDHFKKINYTKGKGYLRNGKLDIDEDKSYNYHCLTLRDFELMGNVNVDCSFLSDEKIKQEQE